MRHPAEHIFQHTLDSLRAWCEARGMSAYRAQQILEWVYVKRIIDPAKMTNLAARDREALASEMTFLSGEIVGRQSASDGTRKLLIEWSDEAPGERSEGADAHGHDAVEQPTSEPPPRSLSLPLANGHPASPGSPSGSPARSSSQTECVMIPSEDPSGPRRTACVSSQIGCPVGCLFCASGLGGLDANLSAGRIVEQVWRLNELLLQEADTSAPPLPPGQERRTLPRITNIVFMGMGEPLSNFGAVIHAVRTLAAPWGFHISARKITISTVGLPKAIERLADELELPVTLALSLHAPNDALRRRLIPWAEYTTIAELLSACQRWFEKTGREITLEYTLLRGVNDLPEHAVELARVAKTLRANVNLIRYNEVADLEFKRPRDEDVREFQRLLTAKNVNTHIRRSRGRDIAAACGQLRHEHAANR
jgi:23S rRNA (adenine2503-C2)-methyltransferase